MLLRRVGNSRGLSRLRRSGCVTISTVQVTEAATGRRTWAGRGGDWAPWGGSGSTVLTRHVGMVRMSWEKRCGYRNGEAQ